MKLKPLMPTLREKKRYIAFEVISQKKISQVSAIPKAIYDAMAYWIGIKGQAEAGIIVLNERYDPFTQKGIIRVSRASVHDVKAGLTTITTINNTPAFIRTHGVSGMIKKAANKYVYANTNLSLEVPKA